MTTRRSRTIYILGRDLTLSCLIVLVSCSGGTETKKVKTAKNAPGQQGGTGNAGAPAQSGGQVEGQTGDQPVAPPSPETPQPTTADGAPSPIPTGEVNNALRLVRRGQYEQAISQAKIALRKNEKYVPAMIIMARAYYHLNKLEFADSICDIALSIDASAGECYNIKGFVALKNENDPLAREQFEKATQAKPGFGPSWLNLGVQYLKVKNYSAAIPPLEKATQLMSNRAEAFLNLGSAYRGNGDIVKAQQSYMQAIKLKATYPAAYFNMGILYLDAQEVPGVPLTQQLNTSISYFTKYKRQMTYLSKDDPVDSYISEAEKAIEREQKRLEREAKKKAREAAKKAPPAKDEKKPAPIKKP